MHTHQLKFAFIEAIINPDNNHILRYGPIVLEAPVASWEGEGRRENRRRKINVQVNRRHVIQRAQYWATRPTLFPPHVFD